MSVEVHPAEVSAALAHSDDDSKRFNSMALAGVSLGLISCVYAALGVTPVLGIVFSTLGIVTFDEKTEKMRWMAGFGLGLSMLTALLHFH